MIDDRQDAQAYEALRNARQCQAAAERTYASLSSYFSPNLAQRLASDADAVFSWRTIHLHVADANWAPAAIGHDCVIKALGRHELVVRLKCDGLLTPVKQPGRLNDGPVRQRKPDRLEIEVHGCELGRVELDTDRRILRAADGYEADPRDLGKASAPGCPCSYWQRATPPFMFLVRTRVTECRGEQSERSRWAEPGPAGPSAQTAAGRRAAARRGRACAADPHQRKLRLASGTSRRSGPTTRDLPGLPHSRAAPLRRPAGLSCEW